MNLPFGRGPATPRTERDPWTWLIGALLVVAVGIVLGIQYVAPDKRVLAVMAATVVLGIAWRLDLVSGIGMLLLLLPFPRSNVYGSTNVAFILLLLILWFLRMSQGSAARPRRTALDAPIIALLMAFLISFYNVEAHNMRFALANYATLLSGVVLFYLIVHNVRSSRDLERIHQFQIATITIVCLIAVFELNHPGAVLIPGWIDFKGTTGEALNTRNIRVGGPFFDFELLSEFCAISMMLVLFHLVRARTPTRRVLMAGLLMLVAFIQFATVTRGGIIALVIGLFFLMWLLRRRIQFVPLVLSVTTGIALFLAMNFYVAHFTRSGDLLKRVLDPQTFEVENGMPLNRSRLWVQAFERMMRHPIIGHGPYYDVERGTTFWYWPHNGYLFIGNLVGIIGLAIYVWLLIVLWRQTRPGSSTYDDPDYARAFLVFGHAQLFIFLVDQFKIDFMRNAIYTLHVFVMWGVLAAAGAVAREAPESAGRRTAGP
jgi:O-antigen ligase